MDEREKRGDALFFGFLGVSVVRNVGWMFAASSQADGFPSRCAVARSKAPRAEFPTHCFAGDFLYQAGRDTLAQALQVFRQTPSSRSPS
jgi:hypothetical protein